MMQLAAILFMVGIDVAIWTIIRVYDRKGVILALPWPIDRDRSPRWFRFNMAMLRLSLALGIAFTVVVSFLILFPVTDASN